MPRHSRVKSNTNVYHVMCRALNKQLLFEDEIDYLRYLQIISTAKKEFSIRVYAYCLMSNHVHLIIKDNKNCIEKVFKSINSKYAKYYNKKNSRVGYVFSDRYKSEAIENYDYLKICIRYIHQNPLKAEICNSIYKYKFSSIHAYKSDKGNLFNIVDTKGIYKMLDKEEFLEWNERSNQDKCLDAISNKLNDSEALEILLKHSKCKNLKEFNYIEEPLKMMAALKMIDNGISMMQISRVSGVYYSKIQKLKKGQDGKVTGLTYYK